MTKLQKQVLFWLASALFVVLVVFLGVNAKHTLDTAATSNTVSFSGEGKVTSKPDVAVVSLSIVTEAPTSKAAQDENSRKSNSLMEFLKKQGIDEKDIKTESYNIYPQYNYPQQRQPQIAGYQVSQSIQVKVRDLDNVDKILDGVVAAGVNQVNNLQLTIDEPEKLKDEARAKAIADAKEKASSLEKQLGIGLGRIINFSENAGGYPPPVYFEAKAAGAGVGGGGPSVPTGENEISVSVTITYQIK